MTTQGNNSNFIFTTINKEVGSKPDFGAIGSFIRTVYDHYKTARREKENTWLECWALYLGTPKAMEYARHLAHKSVGDAKEDWRHKVSTAKAFENVETINSYLQSAFFPNRDWFDMVPMYAGSLEVADVVKKYLKHKLKQSNFRTHWDLFIRQLLITGTSVLALPWRREVAPFRKRVPVEYPVKDELGYEMGKRVQYEEKVIEKTTYNGTEFEVLDVFDCFLDPDNPNPNESNFIRKMVKTKGELMRLVQAGFYPELDEIDVVRMKGQQAPDNKKNLVANFQGIEWKPNELCEILEFWGDVETGDALYIDVVVTYIGGKVARFENNPYWSGKPFVVGTYIPICHSVYGVGSVEPVMGMLHELAIVTNQRLDNLELSVDTMWTYIDDGTINPEDVYTAPGKLIEVADHNSIKPLVTNNQFTINYQEASLLESTIDKVTGTGAFIGVGQGRSGERVTAQEVQATRDAGGNRLSGIHRHVEETALYTTLKKVYRMCQQFVTDDEVIRIPGYQPGEYLYVKVGVEELTHDYDVEPVGAGHIADKEYELQKRLDFLGVINGNPMMAQMMDWEEVLKDLAKRFGFDDVERFIKKQAEAVDPMATPEPTVPGQLTQQDIAAIAQGLEATGGQPAMQWGQAQAAIDGGAGAMDQTMTDLGITQTPVS